MIDITEDQRKAKAIAVQNELKGLKVEYLRHYIDGDGVNPDMARVNGHSVIWHSGAYADPNELEVEVYLSNEYDVRGHVPIKGLRELIK